MTVAMGVALVGRLQKLEMEVSCERRREVWKGSEGLIRIPKGGALQMAVSLMGKLGWGEEVGGKMMLGSKAWIRSGHPAINKLLHSQQKSFWVYSL